MKKECISGERDESGNNKRYFSLIGFRVPLSLSFSSLYLFIYLSISFLSSLYLSPLSHRFHIITNGTTNGASGELTIEFKLKYRMNRGMKEVAKSFKERKS